MINAATKISSFWVTYAMGEGILGSVFLLIPVSNQGSCP